MKVYKKFIIDVKDMYCFCVFNFYYDELKEKKVYKLDVEPKIPSRGIGLCYAKRNIPSFCTKKLIEIIMEDLKNK